MSPCAECRSQSPPDLAELGAGAAGIALASTADERTSCAAGENANAKATAAARIWRSRAERWTLLERSRCRLVVTQLELNRTVCLLGWVLLNFQFHSGQVALKLREFRMNRLRMGASMAPCGQPRYWKHSLVRRVLKFGRQRSGPFCRPSIARYENIKGPSAREKNSPAPGRGWATSFQKRGGLIVRDADKSENFVALAHISCGTGGFAQGPLALPFCLVCVLRQIIQYVKELLVLLADEESIVRESLEGVLGCVLRLRGTDD